MCDLNGLKKRNDMMGHEAGDQYICDAAQILCSCFEKEHVYRIGGDEFVVITLCAGMEDMEERIEKLRLYTKLKEVSLSVGHAYRKEAADLFEDIMREADQNMYEEKQQYYASMQS